MMNGKPNDSVGKHSDAPKGYDMFMLELAHNVHFPFECIKAGLKVFNCFVKIELLNRKEFSAKVTAVHLGISSPAHLPGMLQINCPYMTNVNATVACQPQAPSIVRRLISGATSKTPTETKLVDPLLQLTLPTPLWLN